MNSIATYKESLSRIANEVFDDAEELDIPQSRRDGSPASGRRISHRSSRFAHPMAVYGSPVADGIEADSGSPDEISKYKADIQRLLASEAELKAFSLSYAAMLKEKEEQLSKLHEEYGSLRKSMDAKESAGHVFRDDSPTTLSNNFRASADRSPSRLQKNSRSGSHLIKNSITKQDGLSNGSMQAVTFDATLQKIADSQGNEASYESEIKQLKAQLDSERESVSTIKLKLQEECQLKEFSQKELLEMKIEKEKTFNEMKEVQKELGEKIVELKQLQVELSRRDKEEWNETLENLKNAISVLEKENAQLKTEKQT